MSSMPCSTWIRALGWLGRDISSACGLEPGIRCQSLQQRRFADRLGQMRGEPRVLALFRHTRQTRCAVSASTGVAEIPASCS